jgi:HAE1 family hydrophobic/amphiphilic exporter-1
MTTIAMVFGMFPIALASGAEPNVKRSFAIEELISSLFLTLVVVPVIYQIMESSTEFLKVKSRL